MNFPELLICAKAGDNDAAERILTMYQPLLVKESVLEGQCHQLKETQHLLELHGNFDDLCLFRRSVERPGRTGTTAFVRRTTICAYNRSRFRPEEVESISTTVLLSSEMVIATFSL